MRTYTCACSIAGAELTTGGAKYLSSAAAALAAVLSMHQDDPSAASTIQQLSDLRQQLADNSAGPPGNGDKGDN